MHKLRDASGDSEEDLKRKLEETAGKGTVYVLGLGNTDRADDGAGVMVALALKKLFPSNSYSEHDGVEGTVLDISERREDAAVIFVDAANLGEPPGTIKIVTRDRIRDTEITTHRVAVALMASVLDKAGLKSAVVCIQPAQIKFQGKVSTQVARSVKLITKTLGEVMAEKD